MKCCACKHVVTGADGLERSISCQKENMAPVLLRLLASLKKYHLERNDLLNYRMWTALTPLVMKGLPSDEIILPPQSVDQYLAELYFSGPHAEVHDSGFTPLICAAISGNVSVVKELITREHVNVKASFRVDLPKFGIEKKMDALTCTAAMCEASRVHETISLLVEAPGVDPNATFPGSGGTPLMAAVMWHNLAGVNALIRLAGGKLDLEKGLRINNATALLIAGNVGTFEVIEALIQAGANRKHR